MKLKKTTIFEIVFDDDISDGIENKLNIISIGGTREVSVYLFGIFPFVKILELHLYISGRLFVRVIT